MTAQICTCPIEAAIHHPSCVHAELLSDVGAFVMGADRHRFGPLAATREPS